MGKHSRRGARARAQFHPGQALVPAYPPYPQPPMPYAPKAQVNVEVLGAKNATVAKLTLSRHADWTASSEVYRFEAAEASKREQGDVSDAEIGELLALGRAFQRLSRDLFREGHKRVRKASEARAAAEVAARAKRLGPPKVVQHRPLEEWEKIQQQRYENQGGQNNLKEVQKELLGTFRAESGTLTYGRRPEETVKYNPADAEILNRWFNKNELNVEELKAQKQQIEETLRLLGEAE